MVLQGTRTVLQWILFCKELALSCGYGSARILNSFMDIVLQEFEHSCVYGSARSLNRHVVCGYGSAKSLNSPVGMVLQGA